MAGCKLYQVQQKKKSNKWSCVVCGTNQSVMRIHFESTTAPDCRKYVQEMNKRIVMRAVDQTAYQEEVKKVPAPKVEEFIDFDHGEEQNECGGLFKGISKRPAWEDGEDLNVIEKENHPTGSRWKQYDTISSSDSE
jgi:hypothetical protein